MSEIKRDSDGFFLVADDGKVERLPVLFEASTRHIQGTVLQFDFKDKIDAAVEAERQAAWDAIDAAIPKGELSGNGCDEQAQRNGMILAANILFARLKPKGVQ